MYSPVDSFKAKSGMTSGKIRLKDSAVMEKCFTIYKTIMNWIEKSTKQSIFVLHLPKNPHHPRHGGKLKAIPILKERLCIVAK